jgi:hypothetical protein
VAALFLLACSSPPKTITAGPSGAPAPRPRPAAVDRGLIAAKAQAPAVDVGQTKPSPPLKPKAGWFAYKYEAEADPRFLGRAYRKDAPEPPIGFLPIAGFQSGTEIHKAPMEASPVVARMLQDRIKAPVGDCGWYTFHPLADWSGGRVRCGDVVTTDVGDMLPVFEQHGSGSNRWFRVVADVRGQFGWVRTSTPDKPRPLVEQIKGNIVYSTRFWRRRLHRRPGKGKGRRFKGVKEPRVKVLEVRVLNKTTWLRVSLHLDQCNHERSKDLKRSGWIPLFNDSGDLTVWYEVSC